MKHLPTRRNLGFGRTERAKAGHEIVHNGRTVALRLKLEMDRVYELYRLVSPAYTLCDLQIANIAREHELAFQWQEADEVA